MSNTFRSSHSNAAASGIRETVAPSSSASSTVRPPLSTMEAYFWPSQYKLYHEYHSLFVDLQSRMNQLYMDNQVNTNTLTSTNILTLTNNRLAILREQSSRYRTSLKRASQQIQEHPGPERETDVELFLDHARTVDQKYSITTAVWHMTDVAFLHSHSAVTTAASTASASSSSSLILALLQCIRENFVQTVDESMYLRIVVPLRSTAAVLVPRIQIEVWDLVAKLVIEGQPRDAGKLLNELGTSLRDTDILSFAALLQDYPVLTSSGTDISATYVAHWDNWKAKAVTARRNYYNDSKRHKLVNTNNPQEYHVSRVQQALYDILSGNPWGGNGNGNQMQGLQALPVDPQSIVFDLSPDDKERLNHDKDFQREIQQQTYQPYADWSHLFICTLLYGDVAPNTLGHSTLAKTLRECMEVDGVQMVNIDDIEDTEERLRQGSNHPSAIDPQEQATNLLLSTLTKILERDAIAPLRLLHYFKDHAAAAHIADILWHAGQLDTVPVLMNDPLNVTQKIVAPRAHFILSYAKQLLDYDARFARVAVSYASIVSLDTVLASTGIPVSVLQSLANERQDTSLSYATMLLGIESSSLNGPLKRAKLALMTGSAPLSVTTAMLDKALRTLPLVNDSDVTNAIALAQRVDRYETAREIGHTWIQQLIARGLSFYGTALLWSIRLNMVNEVDTIARHLLDYMYTTIETYLIKGNPAAETQAWNEENLSEVPENDDDNHSIKRSLSTSSVTSVTHPSHDPLSTLYKFRNLCEPQSFFVLSKRWAHIYEALVPVDQTLSCVGHSTVVTEENETYTHPSCTDSIILRTFLSTAYDGNGGVYSNSLPNYSSTTKVCSAILHRCLLVRRILGELMEVVKESYHALTFSASAMNFTGLASSSSANYSSHRRSTNGPRNLGSLNDKKWIVQNRTAQLYRDAGADIATFCHSELDTDLVTSNALSNEYTDEDTNETTHTPPLPSQSHPNLSMDDKKATYGSGTDSSFSSSLASSSKAFTAPMKEVLLMLQTAAISGLFDAAEVPPDTRIDQVESNLHLIPPIDTVDIRILTDRLEEGISIPGLDTNINKENSSIDITNDIAASLRVRLLYCLARSTFPVVKPAPSV